MSESNEGFGGLFSKIKSIASSKSSQSSYGGKSAEDSTEIHKALCRYYRNKLGYLPEWLDPNGGAPVSNNNNIYGRNMNSYGQVNNNEVKSSQNAKFNSSHTGLYDPSDSYSSSRGSNLQQANKSSASLKNASLQDIYKRRPSTSSRANLPNRMGPVRQHTFHGTTYDNNSYNNTGNPPIVDGTSISAGEIYQGKGRMSLDSQRPSYNGMNDNSNLNSGQTSRRNLNSRNPGQRPNGTNNGGKSSAGSLRVRERMRAEGNPYR